MVDVVQWLIGLPLGLGGFVIGASYPLMVLIGIHHTLTMVETSLLANTGFNALIQYAMYGFANVGRFICTQDSKVRVDSHWFYVVSIIWS